jgi:hypothetical protein
MKGNMIVWGDKPYEIKQVDVVVWTIESVKEQLPKVQVRLEDGRIVHANICGRRNKFATVWCESNQAGWEFAWVTIVRCLNEDRPLRIL